MAYYVAAFLFPFLVVFFFFFFFAGRSLEFFGAGKSLEFFDSTKKEGVFYPSCFLPFFNSVKKKFGFS